MGLVYGKYGGSSKDLQVGGLSFQPSYLPHGGIHLASLKKIIPATD